MTISRTVLALGVLALGQAFASDPKKTQDPPGAVGVDQPAGVSIGDRNTERDTTDTLRGGGRTDVIDGKRAGRRAAGPSITPSEARAQVQAGSEARTSFEGATSESGTSSNDSGESTSLGTDLGYGTGTDTAPASPAR